MVCPSPLSSDPIRKELVGLLADEHRRAAYTAGLHIQSRQDMIRLRSSWLLAAGRRLLSSCVRGNAEQTYGPGGPAMAPLPWP
jgi:hypothetical protein